MSCSHCYYSDGHRTYGANVPGFAQGAYFPGDEPGDYCDLTKEPCPNADGRHPMDCVEKEELNLVCPSCSADGIVHLAKNAANQVFCPVCGIRYETDDELLDQYSMTIIDMDADIRFYKDQSIALQSQVNALKKQLDDIRALIIERTAA